MSNIEAIDDVLARTLDDVRLSRGERKRIEAHFDQIAADPDDLALWRSRAFALARSAMAEGSAAEVLDWLEGIEKLLAHRADSGRADTVETRAYFTPGDEGPRAIAGLFGRARVTVNVCVFTITDDRITSAIVDAHRRGVAVRLITDNDKALDLGSDIEGLRRAGVAVRTDRDANHMHHKFAIFDRRILLTGSYNWTRGAAEFNAENFITTSDPGLVMAFDREFERLWTFLA